MDIYENRVHVKAGADRCICESLNGRSGIEGGLCGGEGRAFKLQGGFLARDVR